MNSRDLNHFWENQRIMDADLRKWITTIQRDGRGLTTWEEEFIEDCSERLDRGGYTFTAKQREIIERIYADKTPN